MENLARESWQRGVSTKQNFQPILTKSLEQRNKHPYFHFFLLIYINFLSIYLINSITYTTPPPHPQFKFRSIRKQKTGTRLEQLEQTRPPLQNYRSLTP
jgi:hypothetical protein